MRWRDKNRLAASGELAPYSAAASKSSISLYLMSESPLVSTPSRNSSSYEAHLNKFWSGNVRLMLILLAFWALAGLGCGILFADTLNEINVGGFPLGFWFSQQGSIIVFVVLILVFCLVMNRRDLKHHEKIEDEKNQSGGDI